MLSSGTVLYPCHLHCYQQLGAVQVSFVNSICTSKGGTHVKAVVDQICKCALQKNICKPLYNGDAMLLPSMII